MQRLSTHDSESDESEDSLRSTDDRTSKTSNQIELVSPGDEEIGKTRNKETPDLKRAKELYWSNWKSKLSVFLVGQLLSLVGALGSVFRVELQKKFVCMEEKKNIANKQRKEQTKCGNRQWDAPTLLNSTVYLLLWLITLIYMNQCSPRKDKLFLLAVIVNTIQTNFFFFFQKKKKKMITNK
ncbi:hypothetical protein RFI_20386 [Reticulomyxa filosa]|uniref:Uncharacterized protein n=1 Tax=Reticulomyxa filosa TaxID=46433 RepID=X6MV37_RETFI|nr:hypothetical protein RFI_20386 [Reticulomyxa filosa]|eukprot:ETO16950.1 hypothetical protein RFI_20386 [Reticulomyxa filosa]